MHPVVRLIVPCLCLFALVVVGCGDSPEVNVDEVIGTVPAEAIKPIPVDVDDWPWWRGPNRNATALGQSIPTTWSETENVIWKTSVPGRGLSSPAISAGKIFLTTADEQQQTQLVLCFDCDSGQMLWQQELHKGHFEKKIHSKTTHAAPTIACDGKHAFAVFLNDSGIHVTALTYDGKITWQRRLGGFVSEFGYASSPALYGPMVIVLADNTGGGYLAALNRENGEVIWLKKREPIINYCSPNVVNVAGQDQLLISGGDKLVSYNPTSGEENWSVPCITATTCGTIVFDQSHVFAAGGYPDKETISIRADGSETVAWRNGQKIYVPSLLAYDGHIYAVTDDGRGFCWDARTGDERWKARLGGAFSASPTVTGDQLVYVSSEGGTTHVFRATPDRYESVAQNQLGDETFASPAICGNRLYLRVADSSRGTRQEFLYCIGTAE